MNNIKKITLDNGLKIILNQDKSKYRTTANIFISVGGLNNQFLINDKEFNVHYGIAHFLEHYLIEQSIYGNAIDMFSKEYIDFNGLTYNYCTNYYISTVHDFKDNFIKLLDIVNKPDFRKERINCVKKPIIAEINKNKDSYKYNFNKKNYNSIFYNEVFDKILGNISTINNMSVKLLKEFHSNLYQPINQMIVITGNFDDNIINIIKDYYNTLHISNNKVKQIKIIEPNNVKKKSVVLHSKSEESFVTISYKIKVDFLSPLELDKLDYYIGYIFESNFGEESALFKYLIENKLTVFAISYKLDNESIKDYFVISLTVYTEKFNKVINLIEKQINNLIIDESYFKTWKKNLIIKNINQTENINYISNNLIDNILVYDLYQFDDIEFIKNLNIKELKNMIEKLDLSNICIIKNYGFKKNI